MAKKFDKFPRGSYAYMRVQVVSRDSVQNGSPFGDVVVVNPVDQNGQAMRETHYVCEESLITPRDAAERILNRA